MPAVDCGPRGDTMPRGSPAGWQGMTGDRPGSTGRDGPGGTTRDGNDGGPSRPPSPDDGENLGWTIFSYLLAGMLVYGGIGWLVGHWTGHPLIFPLGALAGLALSVGVVIYRYGRS